MTSKLDSFFCEKSKTSSHLLTVGSSSASRAYSLSFGYPRLNGPNLSPDDASIIGSLAAYKYTDELYKTNDSRVIAYLLFEISASELLTGDLNNTILAISYEYWALDWPNHQGTILALINRNLSNWNQLHSKHLPVMCDLIHELCSSQGILLRNLCHRVSQELW